MTSEITMMLAEVGEEEAGVDITTRGMMEESLELLILMLSLELLQ